MYLLRVEVPKIRKPKRIVANHWGRIEILIQAKTSSKAIKLLESVFLSLLTSRAGCREYVPFDF